MKSIIYLARITNKESVGIINKVKNTAKALEDHGYNAKSLIFHQSWFKGSINVALRLLFAKEDLIILRSDHHTLIVMLLPMLIVRLRQKKLIIDIANPVRVAVKEIDGTNSSWLAKKMKKILLHMTFPLCLFPANRIFGYAKDDAWFTFGVNNKFKIIGNGVLVNSIRYRKNKPVFDQNNLNLIGAGHLAFWHGFDRLIRSINSYNLKYDSIQNKVNINFWIVGDGFEKDNLMKLTKELNLEDQVHFLGVKEDEELAKCFDDAHVGVCNLAQFRKNLFFNSELKGRDYSARGIPFILACEDYDFDKSLPFVYSCENDNTIIDLDEIISWYKDLDKNHDEFLFIREFAIEKLDYKAKVKHDIISLLD